MTNNFLEVIQYYNPFETPVVGSLPNIVEVELNSIQSVQIRANYKYEPRSSNIVITGMGSDGIEYILLDVRSLEVADDVIKYVNNNFNIESILKLKNILHILNASYYNNLQYSNLWNMLKINLNK